MNVSDFPNEIINEYNLRALADKKGTVVAKCKRCVYGLPQAGILANKYLEKRLNDYGYYQSDFTNGLWMHKSHTVAKIIKAVMSSGAGAELGGLFINAKIAVPIRTTLEELGHKQPPTPIQTD
jgi:Zn-finger protein